MTIVESIILGVVEGLTEFLPISSTAHLVIASEILRVPESTFLGSFIIAIQLGAIASVVVLYWKTILWDIETMKRVMAAFIPTALVGFALYAIIKNVLFENLTVIAWALLLGGVVLIMFERLHRISPREGHIPLSHLPYSHAILIGCAQSLAVIPGVSRAGATIIGGLSLGLERKEIVEFSFLLAIPTMLAATGYDLIKSGTSFAVGDWQLLAIGFIIAFVAAYLSVRFLISFVSTHSFESFGWYRIVLGVSVLVFLVLV